jgi:uncharacterized damage-inducible protein DinB
MSLSQALLPELDQEAATTRRVLERIPDDRLDWKPHAKSMSLGQLGAHLSNLMTWGKITLERDSFDVGKPEDQKLDPGLTGGSTQEMLATFDRLYREFRELLQNADDETLMQPWSLRNGDQIFFTQPKVGVLRSMVLSHSIHHRGQLTVYLRLNDVPLPSVYGPSADEGFGG